MNFMVRPSKSFLFDVLEAKLSKIRGEVGLDAACADFKNHRMFKTEKYFGLDIDLDALRSGLTKPNTENSWGIFGSLTKIDSLPENSIDVVVSTNTIYHLSSADRLVALKNLCRLVAPSGIFLCDLPVDKDFNDGLAILQSNFNQLEVIYYKNIFSRIYEKIFEKDGYLGSHPIAGLRPFRLLAWLISRLEFLTKNLKSNKKQVFIICSDKKNTGRKNTFDLFGFSQIDEKIFKVDK